MDDTTPSLFAQRTCLQCKASKKKCDKLVPKCSRCLRLAAECIYNDHEVRSNDHVATESSADSRFDEVFQRLQRLEAQVFHNRVNASEQEDTLSQDQEMVIESLDHSPHQTSGTINSEIISPDDLFISPGHLRLEYMSKVLFGSLINALKEDNTTVRAVSQQYFANTHKWLPLMWQAKFERQIAAFNNIEKHDKFLLVMLAMHLLVRPKPDNVQVEKSVECSRYRTCKYHFAQYVALGKPCIELVQMGILVALHEYLQDIGGRAFTTIGICVRIAFDLGLDEVVARQSECVPGEMKPEDEEVVLTWWGLSRLERYFNMPPNPFPKHPSMPVQEYTTGVNNGRVHLGPPITKYSIIDEEILDYSVAEFEASRRLGRVQIFVRQNHNRPIDEFCGGFETLMREIQEHTVMLRLQMRTSHSYAGIAINLSAALQLQLFFCSKQTSIDDETLRLIHSIITQMSDIMGKCRLFNGFTDNYMEGRQATWFTIPFHLISAYSMVRQLDTSKDLPEIDLSFCVEVLKSMKGRYRLAGKCLELLQPL